MEFVNNELHNLRHVVHGTFCITGDVHALRAQYLNLNLTIAVGFGFYTDYGAGLCFCICCTDEVDRFAASHVNILAIASENVVVSVHVCAGEFLSHSLLGYKGQEQAYA